MIRVKGYPNLYRDENSGAIINCDNNSYNQYINSLNNRKNQKKEIEELKSEIKNLKLLMMEFLNESK